MKVPTGVDHFAAKKQISAVEDLGHRQLAVGVLVRQLDQVVRLQVSVVLVMRIHIHLQQARKTMNFSANDYCC